MTDRTDEPTIKELLAGAQLSDDLDAETKQRIEKWLQASSPRQVEATPEPIDEQIRAIQERRARACAAVDPAFVAKIERQYEIAPASLIKFQILLDIGLRDDMPMFHYSMIDQLSVIAEPREYELPEEMRDELRITSPQALLRDLHRVERDFVPTFDIVDIAESQRLDIVAAVSDAMSTCWTLPPLGPSPFKQEHALLEQDRTCIYRSPWISIRMPNRTVTE